MISLNCASFYITSYCVFSYRKENVHGGAALLSQYCFLQLLLFGCEVFLGIEAKFVCSLEILLSVTDQLSDT